MRRSDKHIVAGAVIGAGVFVLADIFFQWLELKKEGKLLNWNNYNGIRGVKKALIGTLIGAGTGHFVYNYKIDEESKLPFSPDTYLKRILAQENMKANPLLFNDVLSIRNQVISWLNYTFGHLLVSSIEETGSFHKRTAINSNFDLDITLAFRRYSYNTLEEMYNDVFEKIKRKYSSVAVITKQKKTIGLTFRNKNNEIHIDIAPGREINNYVREKELNFYTNPNFPWQSGGAFKTNVTVQKNMTTNKPEVRKVVKLIKVYRDKNELTLPSLIIEQLAVGAFNKSTFDWKYSLFDNLVQTMTYIASKLNNQVILDQANSNNNLLNKMNSYQRSIDSEQLFEDAKKIEENPRMVKEIFEV